MITKWKKPQQFSQGVQILPFLLGSGHSVSRERVSFSLSFMFNLEQQFLKEGIFMIWCNWKEYKSNYSSGFSLRNFAYVRFFRYMEQTFTICENWVIPRIPEGLRWIWRQLLNVYEVSRIYKVAESLLCYSI